MNNILRKLCAWICVPIYNLIPSIYKIFYNIASARFFDPENTDIIQKLSQNLYVLISVIMLFGFSITILSAIVNPDLISDNKKGVPAMFKRAIIGLALIVIVPFGFDEMYKIQNSVMSNSLVEKIIVGADFSCDKTKNPDCEVGQGGGQVIAGILINSVLHPADDDVTIGVDLQQAYTDMVQSDIGNITTIAGDINAKRTDGGSSIEDEDYGFHFDSLIAIIAGIGVDYMLLIFAIDMAVRMFKLAFMEITAPISIVSYVAVGDKIFMSWLKEVGKTFADVFIKIASIAFYLFLVSNIHDFFAPFKNESWGYVLKAFLIVGMLIFVKQIPNMISAIFGIEMKSQGGIGGRLGQMAMVGDQAKKAWQGIKNVAGLGAAAAGLGLAAAANPLLGAAVGGAFAAGKHGWNKGFGGGKAWKDTKGGQVLSAGAGAAGAFLRGKNGIAGVKDAAKSWGESSIGQSHAAEKSYAKSGKIQKRYNEKMGLDENGRIKDGTLANVKTNYRENLAHDFNSKVAGAMTDKDTADMKNAEISAIASSKDKVDNMFTNMIENAKTNKGKQTLADLKSSFDSGDLSSEALRTHLKELCATGEVNKNGVIDMAKETDKIEGYINSSSDDRISGLIDEHGNLKMNGIGSISDDYKSDASKAKAAYDSIYNAQNDYTKSQMDMYASTSSEIINKQLKENKGSVNNANAYAEDIRNLSVESSSPSYSGSGSGRGASSGESLNIDLSNFSDTLETPQYVTPAETNQKTGLHLNQQKIAEDKLDEEVSNLMDKYDKMDQQNSNNSDSGPKFKLKKETNDNKDK